jgi:hypothetical protein
MIIKNGNFFGKLSLQELNDFETENKIKLPNGLDKHISMFQGRLPFSSFPIGSDSFGNLFLMSVHPDSYGQIYFWNHES